MFMELDTDQNGTLSKDELRGGIDGVMGSFEAEMMSWDDFFDKIDTNGDGVIDHKEFIVAAFDRKKLINKANLEMAFKIIDKDGDG
mmetsp:Transcript_27472/g.19840  ORF Transcript_27472/g.19840 Transcript_27472/m.19840 type:complete len:86 (+) Transcript_27472:1206-1463(+)|eukprot:CAMPEP_0116878064 /NCGR_PEP_ID=MMETSP0463-20121206/9803_1 /TAXON_ID=181622 /ORGANISM="Strombidinopsis sp, Strain SopsisLIS2011" /LENGTH=85 /DNA_ID=CAMNT_0004525889 /DNA_START=1196 /DNA_END=1453 /DNA_ORIENTATION=-